MNSFSSYSLFSCLALRNKSLCASSLAFLYSTVSPPSPIPSSFFFSAFSRSAFSLFSRIISSMLLPSASFFGSSCLGLSLSKSAYARLRYSGSRSNAPFLIPTPPREGNPLFGPPIDGKGSATGTFSSSYTFFLFFSASLAALIFWTRRSVSLG